MPISHSALPIEEIAKYPLPGMAIPGAFAFSPFSYVAPNMFSGSVFDLRPDTDYELSLTLADPDGVVGDAQRTLHAHTRAEPQPARPRVARVRRPRGRRSASRRRARGGRPARR